MIIKDNMANMCAKVTSTYIEFTLAFGPKPEFSFSFKCRKNSFGKEKCIIKDIKRMFCFVEQLCIPDCGEVAKKAEAEAVFKELLASCTSRLARTTLGVRPHEEALFDIGNCETRGARS